MQTDVYKQTPPHSTELCNSYSPYVRSHVGFDDACDQLDTCTGIYKDVQLKSKLQRPGNLSAHRCVIAQQYCPASFPNCVLRKFQKYNSLSFLGALAKLRKATTVFIMSVRME
jgi:hypothetical protein